MALETERLVLRPWADGDAEPLFTLAKDPAVGTVAGWPPHQSVQESLQVIRTVLSGPECYAICERGRDMPVGAVELMLNGRTGMTARDDECELGYWLGRPFWGRGYMTEAAAELVRRAFETLGMRAVWCGYYDGNERSRRVQEKLGFVYHHTEAEIPVPLLHEVRKGHTNCLTRERWQAR